MKDAQMRDAEPAGREAQVLDLWERGIGLERWRRDDALMAAYAPPPSGLGARNKELLGIRNRHFNQAWPLKSSCPACAVDCEFEADSRMLAQQLDQLEAAADQIDWCGRKVAARAPDLDDLKVISVQPDIRSAALTLAARCLSPDFDLSEADETTLENIGLQLEKLDPSAAVSFALHCPACAHEWSAFVDVGDAIWTELQAAAERSLFEIDSLARAYGWTEDDVMRTSPMRRAAYLQLVEGI
jgi:hypothetical protein